MCLPYQAPVYIMQISLIDIEFNELNFGIDLIEMHGDSKKYGKIFQDIVDLLWSIFRFSMLIDIWNGKALDFAIMQPIRLISVYNNRI